MFSENGDFLIAFIIHLKWKEAVLAKIGLRKTPFNMSREIPEAGADSHELLSGQFCCFVQ